VLNFNGEEEEEEKEEEEEHKGPVVGFNKGSERLVARQPGTDLSRLNAWKFENFKRFRQKRLLKRSGCERYLFRIVKRFRKVFWFCN